MPRSALVSVCLFACIGASSTMAAEGADRLAAFRDAQPGETRYVVWVEARPDETQYQVELFVGKVMSVDCNRHSFGGKLHRKTLFRRGESYHAIKEIGPPAATRMACPESATHDEFVTLGGEPYMVTYDSRAPTVVYVPTGFEVRYRIWSAGETLIPAVAQ